MSKQTFKISSSVEIGVLMGTPPLITSSTTKVVNLNADLLDGLNSTAFAILDGNGKVPITQLPQFGAVDSVAGKTGVITLVKADVGLANVDNTSDVNKPISTATQTALNLKAPQSNTYTKAEVDNLFQSVSGVTDFEAILASYASADLSKLIK